MLDSPPILCEIIAPAAAHASVLAEVAATCASDVGQCIELKTLDIRRTSRGPVEPTLTLHLPAELAASQHEVWCLACRLACFCPSARVSVLVLGEDAFRTSHAIDNPLAATSA